MRKAIIAVASRSKRNRLIALLVVPLIAAAGAGVTSCHSKATGGELVLTAAADPGANAFMPPAASPPPTNTQPPPTLQPHGDGETVATLPLPGDRDGLYGGTDSNAEVDRDKIVGFYGANPTQAGAFVEALNSDPTVWWSGARRLTVADIPAYLRELTPAVLRLDTRITNHGFDGTRPTTVQSVFQAGTAVLLDGHGVPRVRGLSGNPLTAPVALRGAPNLVGAPWPGYRPGALAEILATTAAITNFVLVDIITGQAFNRPVGTTGTNDTPHPQPVTAPGPAPATSAPPTSGHTLLDDIDGTYTWHDEGGCGGAPAPDAIVTVTHQGNTYKMAKWTGTLNADGSFSSYDSYGGDLRGAFTTEGGQIVFHYTQTNQYCAQHVVGTKQ
jgi:Domain of unknown function (DUF6777)